MPYIYRYIDLDKGEVIYVGKVTKYKDVGYDPLRKRHEQHTREDWYKDRENVLMQYVEVDSHCDADILETWLINYYDSEQLLNSAKKDWGKCSFDLSSLLFGKWRNFGANSQSNEEAVKNIIDDAVRMTMKYSEGLSYNVESTLSGMKMIIEQKILKIAREKRMSDLLDRYDMQEDFKRERKVEENARQGEGYPRA